MLGTWKSTLVDGKGLHLKGAVLVCLLHRNPALFHHVSDGDYWGEGPAVGAGVRM